MTIGDAARASGLSAHAIRYYEGAGVLPPPARRRQARRFRPSDVRALHWIRRARGVALSLGTIASTMPHDESPREEGAALVRRLIALDERRAQLRADLAAADALRDALAADLRGCAHGVPLHVSGA